MRSFGFLPPKVSPSELSQSVWNHSNLSFEHEQNISCQSYVNAISSNMEVPFDFAPLTFNWSASGKVFGLAGPTLPHFLSPLFDLGAIKRALQKLPWSSPEAPLELSRSSPANFWKISQGSPLDLLMKKFQNKPPNFADTAAILKKYRCPIVFYLKIRLWSAENNLGDPNPRAPQESKIPVVSAFFWFLRGAGIRRRNLVAVGQRYFFKIAAVSAKLGGLFWIFFIY